jgi:hypothetical protein
VLDEILKYRIVIGQALSAVFSISTLILLENYAGWNPVFSVIAAVVVWVAVPKLWDLFVGILQGRY